MNEMLASAPKVSVSLLNSVFSSDTGLFLTSTISLRRVKNAVHRFLDEDDTRIRRRDETQGDSLRPERAPVLK